MTMPEKNNTEEKFLVEDPAVTTQENPQGSYEGRPKH